MKKASKENMVICNMADKCKWKTCPHNIEHKQTMLCQQDCDSFKKQVICIPVEHPQNTEKKTCVTCINARKEDTEGNICIICKGYEFWQPISKYIPKPKSDNFALETLIKSIIKDILNKQVQHLENKVAELEQQIRELKLCDCSLKQQPMKDANVYTATVELKDGKFIEIPKTENKRLKQNPKM